MKSPLTLFAAAMAATVSLGACSVEDARPPQPKVSAAAPVPATSNVPATPSTTAAPTAPAQPTPESSVNPAAKAEAQTSPPATVPAPDDDKTMRTGKPYQEVVPQDANKEANKGMKAFEGG